jgi:addiction module HigA family antidote
MLPELSKIKGIHPGAILKRELKTQSINASLLAESINEHKQTLSAVLNRRRAINPKLSIKLSKYFNVDQDYFMMIQASYDVKEANASFKERKPDLSKFRKVIFWDTNFDEIDWDKNKQAIIKRILERGNAKEINELISFYGKENIREQVKSMQNSRLASFRQNIESYNLAD